jgi:hypothetical protein
MFEKLVRLVGRLLPLLLFYPTWARGIFIITLTLVLVSVFLLLVLYPKALDTREKTLPPPEVRTAIQNDAAEARAIFNDLGLALSGLNTAFVQLWEDLLHYTTANPSVEAYLNNDVPKELKDDVLSFTAALAKLRGTLERVQKDDLARTCWLKAILAHSPNSLAYVKTELRSRGFSETEASVPISDIPLILQFLSLAPTKLQSFKFGPLIEAILETNLADSPAVGKPYKNEALRIFVFGGNLIAQLNLPGKTGKQKLVLVPLGAAILSDIYQCLPDSTILHDALKEKYAKYSAAIDLMQFEFVPQQAVGSDFRFAVEELGKRRDLLVLDLPS